MILFFIISTAAHIQKWHDKVSSVFLVLIQGVFKSIWNCSLNSSAKTNKQCAKKEKHTWWMSDCFLWQSIKRLSFSISLYLQNHNNSFCLYKQNGCLSVILTKGSIWWVSNDFIRHILSISAFFNNTRYLCHVTSEKSSNRSRVNKRKATS